VQVEELNRAIAAALAADPASSLAQHGPVTDPSDAAIECVIKAQDYFISSRRVRHTVQTLAQLVKDGEDLIETLKRNLPDRIGTADSSGNLIEWRIKKLHDVRHSVRHTDMRCTHFMC
jgi:hypothetical protein